MNDSEANTNKLEAEIARLRENESKLNGILSSMADLVFGFDLDGRFIYYHAPAEDLLYVQPEKFIGKNYAEVMPPPINEQLKAAFEKNRRGESADFDYQLQIGAEVRWFSAKVSPIFFNQVFSGSVAVVRDITERQRLLEQLKIFAAIADTAPASITIHDFNGKFLYANQRTFDLHGYSREEFMALNLHELDVPESAQLIAPRMEELKKTGKTSFEVNHLRKDRSTFPLLVEAKMIDYDGQQAILSVASDLTEHKQLEDENKARMREAEILNEVAVGRELKMIELEKEVDGLLQELGRPPRYKS